MSSKEIFDQELVSVETIEEWREIQEYEGLYQVSNLGNVRRLWNGKEIVLEKIKSQNLNNSGYLMVDMWKNNKGKKYLVSRLVARAFPEICGIWFKGCEIDHINTIRTDNRAVNLRVCTHKENMNNPITKKKKGEKYPLFGKFGKEHPKSKPILQFMLNGEFVKEWNSIMDIERELGFNRSSICCCCKGTRNKCGGFIWRYKESA